jgi:hypothetical protein
MGAKGLPNQVEEAGGKRVTNAHMLPVGKLYDPDPEHETWKVLAHPRSSREGYTVNEAVRDSIVNVGFWPHKPIGVWALSAQGKERTLDTTPLRFGDGLFVIEDGMQRAAAALAAQPIMRKKGLLLPKQPLMVPVYYFRLPDGNGGTRAANFDDPLDIAEFHLARQQGDSDLLKTAHVPSAVAFSLSRAARLGKSDEEILLAAPARIHGVKLADDTVRALLQWDALGRQCAALFDAGNYESRDGESHRVDVNLLAALLRVPEKGILHHPKLTSRFKILVTALEEGHRTPKKFRNWLEGEVVRHEIETDRGTARVTESGSTAEVAERDTTADTEPERETASGDTEPKAGRKPKAPRAPRTSAGPSVETSPEALARPPSAKSRATILSKVAEEEEALAKLAEGTSDDGLRVGYAHELALVKCFRVGLALSLGRAEGDVDRVEELPVRVRGVVAEVLNGALGRREARGGGSTPATKRGERARAAK